MDHERLQAVHAGLAAVRGRVAAACGRAGRNLDDVTLLAVSKLQPDEFVQAAIDDGQLDFGENYAQELKRKADAFPSARWHAIGPLQTNKAKIVARLAHAFHALDRIEVAKELGKRRKTNPLPCYAEVNIADETTKAGVAPADLPRFINDVRSVKGVEVVGLMCMPPDTDDPETSRPYFVRLRELAKQNGVRGLSMGTTLDFEVAIEEGATIVRVGRAIFGERHQPQ